MIELKIDSFSYDNNEQVELKDIHLEINKGTCVVLTGKSGCGKSTILRLVNRLIPSFYKGHLKGEIIIESKNILDYENDQLIKKIGCVFQNPSSQFFNVDTESEIAFGCENLGISQLEIHERVYQAAELLGIEHLLHKSIFDLSGGEKQMIAIASVYAMGVDIFLMDEPSANLDDKAVGQLKRVIGQLKKEGKTILIAEHRLHYLKDLSDDWIVLKKGHIHQHLTQRNIQMLTTSKLHEMGLRAIELEPYHISTKSNDSISFLEVNDLSVGYKKRQGIIQNFTGVFEKGMVNGIVGHNGRGKSTFAKCLCGMLKEFKGQILINQQPYSYKKRLGKIYMVLQNTTSQLFSETVAGELALAAYTSKEKCALTHDDVLKRLDLDHLKHRHPMSLSGGEKQRLAIAVGIIQNAEVMLLDEPTSGLDFESMMTVKQLLCILKDQGKYIVVITHDHEFLSVVCDRVIEL